MTGGESREGKVGLEADCQCDMKMMTIFRQMKHHLDTKPCMQQQESWLGIFMFIKYVSLIMIFFVDTISNHISKVRFCVSLKLSWDEHNSYDKDNTRYRDEHNSYAIEIPF